MKTVRQKALEKHRMAYIVEVMKQVNGHTDDIYEALADGEMDDAKVAIGLLQELLSEINETITVESVSNREV